MKSPKMPLMALTLIISITGCGVSVNTTPSSSLPTSRSSPSSSPSSKAPVTPTTSSAVHALQPISWATADQTRMQAIDFLSGSKGFLAGPGGIWETTDGGNTWDSVSSSKANFWGIQFPNKQTGWVWSYHTLMATTDGGETWQIRDHSTSSFISVSFEGNHTGYAVMGTSSALLGNGGPGYGLYQTDDGGYHWHVLSTPFHPLAVAFRGRKLGWVAGDSRIWHTTDGGKQWQPIYIYGSTVPMAAHITVESPNSIWVILQGMSGMNQTSYTVIHYSPSTGWRVVAAKSTAGAGPAPDAPSSAPLAPELAPGPFAAVTGTTAFLGGVSAARNFGTTAIWSTSNGGQKWNTYPPIYGANGVPGYFALSFISPDKGWLVDGLDNTQVLSTNDGGRTWHQIFPPPDPVKSISFVSRHIGYGLGLPGHPNDIVMTKNGGNTWQVVGKLPLSSQWEFDGSGSAMDFMNATTGWVVRQSHLFKTTNGGKTWSMVTLGGWAPKDGLTEVSFIGKHGVVGSPYANTCWWTANGGQTWNEDQHESFSQALTDINPAVNQEVQRVGQPLEIAGSHGEIVWIAFQDQSWALSGNDGALWTIHSFPNALGYIWGDFGFTSATDGWLQSAPGTLYHTTNAGMSWVPVR
ncbi:WD40/YVTN/BNR-like repeat-containing protein [Sulfobacillus thermosulfidooxidans]|uniref:WD40/YVTN/BNR-like repeat-containing protein n=1 Tax=Sulfobacillus thermosulfidooxidans TaxID=28034 RepID=UPI0006B62C0D|nr:hypothetical protein [Sulfobacillus thermosulfidooxidans]